MQSLIIASQYQRLKRSAAWSPSNVTKEQLFIHAGQGVGRFSPALHAKKTIVILATDFSR
jgi:hypothetical protein